MVGWDQNAKMVDELGAHLIMYMKALYKASIMKDIVNLFSPER